MPSDASLLLKQPVDFVYGKHRLRLAPCDLALELAFQTQHERWALNRVGAMEPWTSRSLFEKLMHLFLDRQGGNEYAFGTPVSITWLFSDPGTFEYLLLKLQKGQVDYGGAPVQRNELQRIKDKEVEVYAKLKAAMMDQDFPKSEGNGQTPASQAGEASTPSSPTADLTPSTVESGASSDVPPGA
jgi:hypothetical protein